MHLCTRREIWTSFSCLVLLKCFHMVFSQFKIPANLAQLAVPKMHCLYANAVVQPSVQHCPCYMAWKAKVHTWCRHCHLCINAPMWREKKMVAGTFWPFLVLLTDIFSSTFINRSIDILLEFWCFCQSSEHRFPPCLHQELSTMWYDHSIVTYKFQYSWRVWTSPVQGHDYDSCM